MKQEKTTKRQVNSALGVRKEVAVKFSDFCRKRGLVIAYAAEQALAAWMKEQTRSEGGQK